MTASSVATFGGKHDPPSKNEKIIREGGYAAEVPVDLIEGDTAWSPYLTPADVRKLDAMRLALRAGDLAAAAKHGKVYELRPVVVVAAE